MPQGYSSSRRLGRSDILISLTDIKIRARDEQFPKELYLSDGPAVLAESKSPLRAAKTRSDAKRFQGCSQRKFDEALRSTILLGCCPDRARTFIPAILRQGVDAPNGIRTHSTSFGSLRGIHSTIGAKESASYSKSAGLKPGICFQEFMLLP